jgi:hypothetical protein
VSARRIALALGTAVLGFAGVYVFVYLYRWEWNRALFCLGLFVAVEVAMGVGLLVSRLNKLSQRLDRLDRLDRPSAPSRPVDPVVLARISEAAPPPSRPFAWLSPEDGSTAVFVPILMGAGVVLSGLAWVVERLGAATARPAMERDLAARLTAFALPDHLVPPRETGGSLYHPGACAPAP